MRGLLRTAVVAVCCCTAAVAVAATTSSSPVTDLGDDVAAFQTLLRATDSVSVVLAYDSTHNAGAMNKRLLDEGAASWDLFADAYSVDVSRHPWYAATIPAYRAAEGYTFVVYAPTLSASAAAKKKKTADEGGSAATPAVARPGGVKKPHAFGGPGSFSALRQFIHSKLPEPAQLKKLAGVSSRAAVHAEIAKDAKGGTGGAGRYLVLYSDKDKVSPTLKAIVLRGGDDVRRVVVAKVEGGARAVKVEGLPALVSVVTNDAGEPVEEREFPHGADMTRAAIEDLLARDRPASLARRAAAEAADVRAAVRKLVEPVVRVSSQEAWDAEVMAEAQGLVLVAFLDDAAGAESVQAEVGTLVEVAREERSPVRNVVWVSTAQAYDLMQHLGVEPGSVVFVNAKHGKWTRYAGAFTAARINSFVRSMTRARTSNIGTFPKFG